MSDLLSPHPVALGELARKCSRTFNLTTICATDCSSTRKSSRKPFLFEFRRDIGMELVHLARPSPSSGNRSGPRSYMGSGSHFLSSIHSGVMATLNPRSFRDSTKALAPSLKIARFIPMPYMPTVAFPGRSPRCPGGRVRTRIPWRRRRGCRRSCPKFEEAVAKFDPGPVALIWELWIVARTGAQNAVHAVVEQIEQRVVEIDVPSQHGDKEGLARRRIRRSRRMARLPVLRCRSFPSRSIVAAYPQQPRCANEM